MNKRVSSKDYWILLTDGTNAFDSGVRAGVMQIAREIGISRIRLVNEDSLENIYIKSELFKTGRLAVISHMRSEPLLAALRAHRVPAVLLAEESVQEWRQAIGKPIAVCSVDNRAIGSMAADYLYEQERFRSFLFAGIGDNENVQWWQGPRYKAFADTLREHGYEGEIPQIATMQSSPEIDERNFIEVIKRLERPIGVFCCNDFVARDTINFCESARFSVPGDVAVLGVDDEREICENAPILISSIKVEHVRLGRTALKMLLRQIEGEPPCDRVILCPPVRVVERDSTRRSEINNLAVARALSFIERSPPSILDIPSVVKASGASRSYLSKHFRTHVGRTILEAINDRIMREVKCQLLDSDKTIAEIAEAVGFASSSGLCTVFRRLNGISMREFRAQRKVPTPKNIIAGKSAAKRT